jgi:2-(1,2-epoxy-1,2-dihydrophenyl)acetyl-CoA isomerase
VTPLVTDVREDSIGILTLRRPERHNSLVPELLDGLLRGYRSMDADPEVGCVVLGAEGRSFSTGGDIRAIRDAPDRADYAGRLVGLLNEVIVGLAFGSTPVVAAVHGIVTGGSLGLLLSSDVVVMAADATIRPWYATVGFAPDGGWTAILPSIAGPRRVAATLLEDREVGAREAQAWGLVDRVTPAGEVFPAARASASRVAAGDPRSRAAARRLVRGSRGRVAARLEVERQAFLEVVVGDAATAGMDAFLGGDLR